MKAKIVQPNKTVQKSGSARNAVEYVLRDHKKKSEAEKIIEVVSNNCAGDSVGDIVTDMDSLSALRPDNVNKVWHSVLSLPENEKMNAEQWAEVSDEYMSRMGFEVDKTAFVVVRHKDTDNDHVHIIASRVQIDSKLWSNGNDVYRAIDVCQQLEKDFGLTVTAGRHQNETAERKQAIKKAMETGIATPKTEIKGQIDQAIEMYGGNIQFPEFVNQLSFNGVQLITNCSGKDRLNGCSFSYVDEQGKEHRYAGNKLGNKKYAWAALQRRGVVFDPTNPEHLECAFALNGNKRTSKQDEKETIKEAFKNALDSNGSLGDALAQIEKEKIAVRLTLTKDNELWGMQFKGDNEVIKTKDLGGFYSLKNLKKQGLTLGDSNELGRLKERYARPFPEREPEANTRSAGEPTAAINHANERGGAAITESIQPAAGAAAGIESGAFAGAGRGTDGAVRTGGIAQVGGDSTGGIRQGDPDAGAGEQRTTETHDRTGRGRDEGSDRPATNGSRPDQGQLLGATGLHAERQERSQRDRQSGEELKNRAGIGAEIGGNHGKNSDQRSGSTTEAERINADGRGLVERDNGGRSGADSSVLWADRLNQPPAPYLYNNGFTVKATESGLEAHDNEGLRYALERSAIGKWSVTDHTGRAVGGLMEMAQQINPEQSPVMAEFALNNTNKDLKRREPPARPKAVEPTKRVATKLTASPEAKLAPELDEWAADRIEKLLDDAQKKIALRPTPASEQLKKATKAIQQLHSFENQHKPLSELGNPYNATQQAQSFKRYAAVMEKHNAVSDQLSQRLERGGRSH